MPDYRIGSFTRPGQTIDARPIVVYFARLPGGGDVSGDLEQVIAAVDFALQGLEIEVDRYKLSMWLEHFAEVARIYETARIDLRDADFVFAQLSTGFFDDDALRYETEEDFVSALNLPSNSFGAG